MHMMKPILWQAGRVAAVTFLAAATTLGVQAQQASAVTNAYPALNLQAALKTPVNFFDTDAASSSSSSVSASDAIDATAAEHLTLSDDSSQPPPRRRYGRPRYNDNMHNADGSNKYAFEVGGGFTLPTGGTHSYFSPSYDFQVGGGRNFNKHLAVMVDFSWANFGVQTSTLNNQLALYNALGATDQNGDPLTQLNGSGHVWSFALDPVFNFAQTEKSGAYVTGGVGFYHKTTNFTIPGEEEEETFFGPVGYEVNLSLDKYTSNSIGVNGGVGYTYKPSRFANERFFVEAKFVYTANSRRPYFDGNTGTSLSATYFNAFPQNSAPTTFIPITFGLRF
jgi:hypothetical protein